MIIRAIVIAFFLAGAVFAPLCAQTYPNKPIHLIMPFPTGGGTDTVGRILSQKIGDQLGQPMVLENRPGAGGNIAYEIGAKARPDGYTLVLGASSLSISPSLYKKLNYDPIKDLSPISLVAQVPNLFLVRPSLPVKNLKEFVEYAKANPGKLNYASSGIGTPGHLASELFKSLTKIDIVHVPYKGSGLAMIGLIGGEVEMLVLGISAAIPHIQSGKARALAVLSNGRASSLPDVPTAKEAGMDNYVATTWYGILAPTETPREIVNRLNAGWVRAAAVPDTIGKLQKAGFETMSSSPEQFGELIRAEIALWAKVAKQANISLD